MSRPKEYSEPGNERESEKESDEQDETDGISYYRNNSKKQILYPDEQDDTDGSTYYRNNTKKRKLYPDEPDATGETSNSIPYYNTIDHSKRPRIDYDETSSHDNLRLSRSSSSDAEQNEYFEDNSDSNDDTTPAQDSPERFYDQGSEKNSDKTWQEYDASHQSSFALSEPNARLYNEHSVNSNETFQEQDLSQRTSYASSELSARDYSESNEYSEKVSDEEYPKGIGWHLMKNMGFRKGKGLGKKEDGRSEPVEASTQKGRRGLGLQPSKVGEVPKDFKFVPDDKVPEAKEEVSWIKSKEEPLTSDQLEGWLHKVDFKKKSIDDETTFVDPPILDGILNSKIIFDQLADEQLRDARFRSNPYETIGSLMFLNRAAVKMANLDSVFGYMFTDFLGYDKIRGEERNNSKEEVLYFADVCAGPGGFSEYILYKKGWKAKGFGFTLKGKCDFKLSNFLAGTSETFNPYYGVEDDGDIFKPGNLSSLKEKVLENTDDKGVHFLMADGGFSVEGNENIQEILSKQLYLCQCLAALMLVRTGGHFVVKLFDVFTMFSVSLIYVMYRCFDKVSIHKPVTSRPANSERYLVCKGKRLGAEASENHLYTVNGWLWEHRGSDHDIASLVPLEVIQKDKDFFNYIYKSNCVIGTNQIGHLLKIAQYSKDANLKDPYQNDMKTQCLKLWKLPNDMRTPPKNITIDKTFEYVISKIKSKPPDFNNLINVKQNVLNKPPKLLLATAEDLKAFSNVLKWRFVFLGNKDKSKDLRFFLSNGGNQTYHLDGTRWKLADIKLMLPAKTLFYGEVVKEFSEGGKLFTKTVHIIDAVMLGGQDISDLTLEKRLEQCALFCTALEKPFDTTLISLRCKKLYKMEDFSFIMNKLEIQPTKQDRNAVTVRMPSRNTNKHTFFAIGSLLFIREVKEPWDSAMSTSRHQKYYHRQNRPSEYFILPEMVNDLFSWLSSRILWEWDVPISIYKNPLSAHLNCARLEEYVNSNI